MDGQISTFERLIAYAESLAFGYFSFLSGGSFSIFSSLRNGEYSVTIAIFSCPEGLLNPNEVSSLGCEHSFLRRAGVCVKLVARRVTGKVEQLCFISLVVRSLLFIIWNRWMVGFNTLVRGFTCIFPS